MKRVLVIACHFDDEVLGCGGVLHSLSQREDVETYVHILCDRKRNGLFDEELTRKLQEQSKEVQKILGVTEYIYSMLPDEELHEYFIDVRQQVEKVRDDIQPDIIFVQHPGDINQDHRTAFEAAKIAYRVGRYDKPFKMFTYEVLSSTTQGYEPFHPTWFYELTMGDVQAKIDAMHQYESEYGGERSYEGIMALATHRGLQCNSHSFAEAFHFIQGKGELF